MKTCPDCKVKPGNNHKEGCLREYCPNCGGQLVSCDCYMVFDSEAHCKDKPIPFSGDQPGTKELIAFGWYSRFTPSGWVKCDKDHKDAIPDYNRLYVEAKWSKKKRKWVKR